MKKYGLHMLVLVLVVLLAAGCGGPKEAGGEDVDIDSGKDEITVETDSSELTVSTDMGKSVDLPDGYPGEVLPVYEGLFIQGASKNDDGSYVVIGLSNDSIADISAFYEEVLKDASVMMKESSEENYMNMGEVAGVTYTVAVNPAIEDFGYENSVNLIVMPSMAMGAGLPGAVAGGADSSEAAGGFVIPPGLAIPQDYPLDLMPIMEEKTGELAVAEEAGGRNLLGYMTKSAFEEVFGYYENLFMDAENFSMMTKGPTTIFIGEIDGVMFEVGITENTPATGQNPDYNTLIQVFYY